MASGCDGVPSLVNNMHPVLASKLRRKDARALLLLACRYARLCRLGVWWLERLEVLEGTAICIYLRVHCADQLDENAWRVLT